MDYVRDGDTVVVESISRFARSARDFLELMEKRSEKDVAFISKKEGVDTATPAGRFMMTVFAAVAELEREYIRDRQLKMQAAALAQLCVFAKMKFFLDITNGFIVRSARLLTTPNDHQGGHCEDIFAARTYM